MRGIGVLVLLAGGLPLMAQDKPFDYHSSAELEQRAQAAMAKAQSSAGGSTSDRIADFGDHALTTAARVKTGGPEMHEHWTDVIIVTEGQATMVIGGTVVNPVERVAGSGEKSGSDITGGVTQVVKKGDVINIPAGTPHWIKIAPGDKFAYMNVKVKKG
jgi:mannose-6-phosphate isomerase-like protein (cupin superfamily)